LLNHLNVVLLTQELGMPWQAALPGMLFVVPAISFMLSKLWVYRAAPTDS